MTGHGDDKQNELPFSRDEESRPVSNGTPGVREDTARHRSMLDAIDHFPASLPAAKIDQPRKKRGEILAERPPATSNPKKTAPRDEPDEPHYHGHRDRLRERFRNAGPDAIADYELLELLLFRSIPRRDVKPLAKRLIAEFGTFAEVLGASEARLMDVPEIGPSVAQDLRIVQAAAMRLARGAVMHREVLGSWSAVIEYCRAAMAFDDKERFRILFLDKKNTLIADEVQQTGTVDHTPVYPREVVKRALELSATAIILVHNHPSGDPTPSQADIQMTRQIVDVAKPLGITIHDHVIVGREGHASLRGLKLI